jgi:hypothetical protein
VLKAYKPWWIQDQQLNLKHQCISTLSLLHVSAHQRRHLQRVLYEPTELLSNVMKAEVDDGCTLWPSVWWDVTGRRIHIRTVRKGLLPVVLSWTKSIKDYKKFSQNKVTNTFMPRTMVWTHRLYGESVSDATHITPPRNQHWHLCIHHTFATKFLSLRTITGVKCQWPRSENLLYFGAVWKNQVLFPKHGDWGTALGSE